MADGGDDPEAEEELGEKQKKEIAVWFLTNAPAGEIQYVAKDVRSVLGDDRLYEIAAAEAFPIYNKAHLVSLEMPDRSGDVIISTYGEIDESSYFDPRTAQVATVDHVKQSISHQVVKHKKGHVGNGETSRGRIYGNGHNGNNDTTPLYVRFGGVVGLCKFKIVVIELNRNGDMGAISTKYSWITWSGTEKLGLNAFDIEKLFSTLWALYSYIICFVFVCYVLL